MICFGIESCNDNAERMGLELIKSFFNQLENACIVMHDMMELRVEIVLRGLLVIALERNRQAILEPRMKGKGDIVEITIQTMGRDGLQLTVHDSGGKTACISKKHIDQYADLIAFDLTNGGVMMRAMFKWRSC